MRPKSPSTEEPSVPFAYVSGSDDQGPSKEHPEHATLADERPAPPGWLLLAAAMVTMYLTSFCMVGCVGREGREKAVTATLSVCGTGYVGAAIIYESAETTVDACQHTARNMMSSYVLFYCSYEQFRSFQTTQY